MHRPHSPAQWIETLKEKGWQWAKENADGSWTVAAYKLAYVQNAAAGYVHPTPTRHEFFAAYKRMAMAVGITVADTDLLVREVRALGFDVID